MKIKQSPKQLKGTTPTGTSPLSDYYYLRDMAEKECFCDIGYVCAMCTASQFLKSLESQMHEAATLVRNMDQNEKKEELAL